MRCHAILSFLFNVCVNRDEDTFCCFREKRELGTNANLNSDPRRATRPRMQSGFKPATELSKEVEANRNDEQLDLITT